MAVANALVSKVVDLLDSTTEQDCRLLAGVDQQIRNLTSNLQSIQAMLIDSGERRQLEDATLRAWLDRLKHIIYNVDDVLDEWRRYKMLRSQNERDEKAYEPTWKLRYFNILLPCFFMPVIAVGHRIPVKISTLDARLAVIAAGKDQYISSLLRGVIKRLRHLQTTIEIGKSEVKGREVEKEHLVNILLAESSEHPRFHPVSVVGMTGIGKTTLVKLVYEDEMVMSFFDKRIWICVSKPFNKIRIGREILESLAGHTVNIVDWQSIVVKIQESIEGKRFLLVLDDVWSEDLQEWKELENCLIFGLSGSKLLVTSCKESVAKIMGCLDKDIFRVGFLSNEECWALFCEIAFSKQMSENTKKLETIGVKIVGRCKGLPSVVSTIASLLRIKNSAQEWESVLTFEFFKIERVQRDIFGQLWPSYDDLPPVLKQCFLYCVIFPKSYKMSEDELISLWMAHDFINPTTDGDMEIIGQEYFRALRMRSLLQDFEVVERFNRLEKTYCTMHDIVCDFGQYVMGKECFYMDANSSKDFISMDTTYGDYLYHLNVRVGEKVKLRGSFYNLRKLRSLVISPSNNGSLSGAALPKIFNKLTCLRSLSLSRCRLENIPSTINRLVHLRWHKLSKNYALKELPETICELYNLQTLSVNWCNSLTHFPKAVENLTNLRHLKNNYTYFLLPKGIGKLSGIKNLLRITVEPKSKSAFSLRDLKNLNCISGSLTIFFMERERDTLVEDANEAQLKDKKHITELSLNLPERAPEEWMKQYDAELVEDLKPPKSLEMLRITCYAGANCPSWINTLTSLRKLKLWYWSNCEHLPALAKLPCLEHIEFNSFGRVQKVAVEFLRMDDVEGPSSSTAQLFPKLKNLQFMNMNEWEEWSDYDGDEEVMQCLSYLSIENCPKLKALPNFIHKKATLHKHIFR